jgi:hypothetical protein
MDNSADSFASSSSDTESIATSQDWEDYGSQYSQTSSTKRAIVKQPIFNVLVLHRSRQIGTRNGTTKRGLSTVKPIYKNYRVKVYVTPNYPNAIILNAVTGTAFKFQNGEYARVGTNNEDLFFSVLLATGEAGQTAALLFYDSPEQYERHMEDTLPSDGKANWVNKYVIAKDRLERMKKAKKSVEVK